MNDLNRTQHYTTNASYITNGLLDFIPPNATLVEPFCGAGIWSHYFLASKLVKQII